MNKNSESPLLKKSFDYAVHTVKHVKALKNTDLDSSIISQFIRSGTSVGANLEEAIGGSSKKDFINKLNISYKEARESNFWIRVLHASYYLDETTFSTMFSLNTEIQKMLYVSIRQSRKNMNKVEGFK